MLPLMDWLSSDFYHAAVGPLFLATVYLSWCAQPSMKEPLPDRFKSFRVRYLVAWGLCAGADCLQGTYIYALYSAYGYSKNQIAQLYVAGFWSSMVCGFFVGSMIDRFGRKRSALASCMLYILSCAMQHIRIHYVLWMARFVGGAASTLLFSSFECWMVSEHTNRLKLSDGLLSHMFSSMYILVYGCAVAAGIVAQIIIGHFTFAPIADGSLIYVGGATGPFDLAALIMLAGATHIIVFWDENYGGSGEGTRGWPKEVLTALAKYPNVWHVGTIISCFEGSMFAFVFSWTPLLQDDEAPPPLGLIFTAFMMACTCGSATNTATSKYFEPRTHLKLICMSGILSFLMVTISIWVGSLFYIFMGFLLFEFTVGNYFPTIGLVKSEVVPESIRGTVYSMYRVPVNAVVVCLLLTNLSLFLCYVLCCILLIVAFISSSMVASRACTSDCVSGVAAVGKHS